MFDMKDVQNQHDTGHLTCFMTLMLLVLIMWFIPVIRVDANITPGMDVRD